MFLKIDILISVLILGLIESEAKGTLYLGPAFAECVNRSPNLISSFECHIFRKDGQTYGCGHIMFRRRVESLWFRLKIGRTGSKLGYIEVVNVRLQLCDFLSDKHNQQYMNYVFQIIKKHVNELPRCPLKSNFNYTITDAYFDLKRFPLFIPVGNFSTEIVFFDGNTRAGHFKIYGEIILDQGKKKHKQIKKG